MERLAETLARAIIVESSLVTTFGLDSLAPLPMPETWKDANGSYLAALQAWFVEVDNALARVQEAEVAQVLALSLNKVAPGALKKAQADVQQGKAASVIVRFLVPDSYVRGLIGVRVRGAFVSTIEAHSLQGEKGDSWRGRLHAPKAALAIGRSKTVAVRQDTSVAECGRIQSRASISHPDLVGAAALKNASPIGDPKGTADDSSWTIELEATSLLGRKASVLHDVVIELVLSGLST